MRHGRMRPAVLTACGLVWLAVLAGPPLMLLRVRDARLAEVSRPEAQADWEAFRAAMREESDRDGPVQRKVPKSVEPPELVWLRDYPWLAITAWVVLVGTLGGCFGLMLVGACSTPAPRNVADPS